MQKIGFIYLICNNFSDSVYIGQTNNWKRRKEQHWRNAMNGTPGMLYEDMREYGIENFYFQILDAAPVEKLNFLEKMYIEEFNSYENGYNKTPGGDHGRTEEYSPILEYDLEGYFKKEYNSIADATNAYNLSSENYIVQALDKNTFANNSIWRTKKSNRYPIKIKGIYNRKEEKNKFLLTKNVVNKMIKNNCSLKEIKQILKNKKLYGWYYLLRKTKVMGDKDYIKFKKYSPTLIMLNKNKKKKILAKKAAKKLHAKYCYICKVLEQELDKRNIKNSEIFNIEEYETYLKYKVYKQKV